MLIRDKVVEEQIVFFEDRFHLAGDVRDAGYNIGDLLNMPFLDDRWGQNKLHDSTEKLDRMVLMATLCPNTILSQYTDTRPPDEPVPNIPRIRHSVETFCQKHVNEMSNLLRLVQQPSTLTVHIRTGDCMTGGSYLEIIKRMSRKFSNVLILGGIHKDQMFARHSQKVSQFLSTMNQLLTLGRNFVLVMNTPDVHLCLMQNASHLLVHHGGFSALGAIVAKGKVFYTRSFSHADKRNWKQHVITTSQLIC